MDTDEKIRMMEFYNEEARGSLKMLAYVQIFVGIVIVGATFIFFGMDI